jgi:hypothetical protein
VIRDLLRSVVPERFRPSAYLERLVQSRTGNTVSSGPFAGLKYVRGSRGQAHLPNLLGVYERELHPYIERACALNLSLIVVIGAAEGYYAVGLALRNPTARVIAFEMDPQRRESLATMAAMNGVQSKIDIHCKCEPAELADGLRDTPRALVICDVEGYESALLDPATVPGLLHASVLVELHEFVERGISEKISARFQESHDITRIAQEERTSADFPFRTLYTRLLPRKYLRWTVNEARPERMSWFWMEPRAQI